MSRPHQCDLASDWDGHCSRDPLHPVSGSLSGGEARGERLRPKLTSCCHETTKHNTAPQFEICVWSGALRRAAQFLRLSLSQVLSQRKVTVEVTPMTFITAEMRAASVGRFLISCQIHAHRHGRKGFLYITKQ